MKEKLKKIDKKTKIMVIAFFVLIIIIMFGGAFVYHNFFYKRSYSEIENIMLTAAQSHFKENPNMLPQNLNESVSVSDSDLVAIEKMKPISEYLKDETASCSGKVTVTNINGKHRYVSYLDCGDKYKPALKLVEHIKNNVGTVDSGNGLYSLNNELVYRGDNVNNYIKFSGKFYRIVKIVEDKIVIIYDDKLENKTWDNRYNSEKRSRVGINDYSVSRIRDYLNELYKEDTLISEDDKLLATAHTIKIGKRNAKDTDNTGNLENGAVMENQFVSLLPMYDFLNASLDKNCTNSTNPACSNYNYLSKYKYNWWTITASSDNSYQIFRINSGGNAQVTNASSGGYIRPVLYLTSDAIYTSGDGTYDNPYIVK